MPAHDRSRSTRDRVRSARHGQTYEPPWHANSVRAGEQSCTSCTSSPGSGSPTCPPACLTRSTTGSVTTAAQDTAAQSFGRATQFPSPTTADSESAATTYPAVGRARGRHPPTPQSAPLSPFGARDPGFRFPVAATTSSSPVGAADGGGSCRSFVNAAAGWAAPGTSASARPLAGSLQAPRCGFGDKEVAAATAKTPASVTSRYSARSVVDTIVMVLPQ
jgi:hypothetical protein